MAGSGPDLEYYQERAEQEVKLAQRATDPSVVAAHYELSLLYLERVSNLQAKASPARSEDEAC